MESRRIFGIESPGEFKTCALETFREQYHQVPVYREFCDLLVKNPSNVRRLEDLPFMPIEFFKTHRVLRQGTEAQMVFRSSGTTGSVPSQHYIADLEWYRKSFLKGFEQFYGPPSDYCILAMLPSYQERPDSSLIYMVSDLISRSGHPESWFTGSTPESIYSTLEDLEKSNDRKVLLLGVSFALLDLANRHPRKLERTIVMETGGMKGRRKEMVRKELHQVLGRGFGVQHIHSEYGMTELLSQAYSEEAGLFRCPPWMQVRTRDPEDPLSFVDFGRTGGINVIDLANQNSCSFLATQDLGRLYADGSFEVLGRFDHSDIRGCNLMAL
ncbi:MAG: acyl transferase [Flavobacteriaceae bacterium]|nr:MAG: acyl transferase [Flavobacteriaceae bacterium]